MDITIFPDMFFCVCLFFTIMNNTSRKFLHLSIGEFKDPVNIDPRVELLVHEIYLYLDLS